jgi:predicted Zn-dependent peptidase
MNKPYQKSTFKNGLRLVTVPMKNTQAVTVLVLVGTGSKYEAKKINGISHFLEHMFFRGTKKRPSTLAIATDLDKVGGSYNAFTGQERTGYWAKVDGKHLDLALDWVSDMFLNSCLKTKDIEKERSVILEEINMYLDTPSDHISDVWSELLYGDQPAGWSVLGEEETIKKLKRQNFIDYLQNHYSAKNTVVVVAGDIKRDLKNKIQKYFGSINTKESKGKGLVIEKQKKPKVLIHYKKTDQTHFYLGARGYDLFHRDRYVMEVLSTMLGSGMSSRLWIAVREKEGLGYYVFTENDAASDTGYLATGAGVDNQRVDKAIRIILKEYKRLVDEKVSQKEIRKAKDYIKGKSILRMESSDTQAGFYANQELMENRILTLDQIFAKIEAVTAKDIQRVAKDVFKLEKLNLALIGPFKDKNKFEKILKI